MPDAEQMDGLRVEIAQMLATSYRFVVAYPNALDTVEQDASALLDLIYDAGYVVVPVDEFDRLRLLAGSAQ